MKTPTEAELAAQMASWARAEVEIGSDADEAAYRDAMARGDTEALAALIQKGRDRVAALDRMKP